jgi:hypothetical protein
VPPATTSWGSSARVRHAVQPWRGATIIDHHHCVFSGKGWPITLVEGFVNFHASGKGPRGHETLHHVAVPKLVLNGISVVWASLLKEHHEVVCGQSRLTLAATCSSRGAHRDRAACLLAIANVITGCGCGLPEMLIVPLFHYSCLSPRRS